MCLFWQLRPSKTGAVGSRTAISRPCPIQRLPPFTCRHPEVIAAFRSGQRRSDLPPHQSRSRGAIGPKACVARVRAPNAKARGCRPRTAPAVSGALEISPTFYPWGGCGMRVRLVFGNVLRLLAWMSQMM